METGSLECDESRIRRSKAARVEVERSQMIVEIDVEPLAACGPCLGDGECKELRADSLPSCWSVHHGVEDERVDAAVPRNVDEADKVVAIASANPPEAVFMHLAVPIVVQHSVIERLRMKCVQYGIVELSPPLVRERHEGKICASVQASQPDRANWNNHATLALNVGQVANLGLTLRAAPRPATVGQPLTYVLTVRNLSAIDATGVVLANHVPNRSTLVSATGSQGSCTGSGMISCTLGTIAAGASAQITIVVQPTVVGYVSDRATVKGDQVDPYRANNTRATTVRVRPAT
jgi:uncharacterized repeat protein (TIGR01451 family)